MPAQPPGLKLAHEMITPAEEAELIALIEAAGPRASLYDAGNPRCSTSYGLKYDFQSDGFVPCAPMPEGFAPLAERAAAFAGIAVDDIAECLLNRYEPGAIIQWHYDKPVFEHVIGVSLGDTATMQFRKPVGDDYAPAEAELPPRSIYLLAGESRFSYQHSLPPMKATRWSITFRTLSEAGRRLWRG